MFEYSEPGGVDSGFFSSDALQAERMIVDDKNDTPANQTSPNSEQV
jgi:hypothetical protein